MLKCRLRVGVVATAIGSFFAVAGWSSDVDACTPAPVGWVPVVTNDELPTNGYLVVGMHCYQDCGSGPAQPTITLRDMATGTEVPGSIERIPDVDASQYLYGWRATTPLVAGGSYEVELQRPGISRTPVQVVEPRQPGLETMGLMPSTGPHDLDAGNRTCCEGPINTCGSDDWCWYDRVQHLVWVMLDWSLTSEPAHFGQYLNRVTWNDGEPGPWNIGLSASAEFDTARAEYCYTLELKSLIDGSIERVESACVAHPEGLVLGEFDVDPLLIETQLSVCNEPPAGQEEGWCNGRARSCAEEPRSECDKLEEFCPNEADDGSCAVAATGAEPPGRSAWALSLLAVAFAFRRVRAKRATGT